MVGVVLGGPSLAWTRTHMTELFDDAFAKLSAESPELMIAQAPAPSPAVTGQPARAEDTPPDRVASSVPVRTVPALPGNTASTTPRPTASSPSPAGSAAASASAVRSPSSVSDTAATRRRPGRSAARTTGPQRSRVRVGTSSNRDKNRTPAAEDLSQVTASLPASGVGVAWAPAPTAFAAPTPNPTPAPTALPLPVSSQQSSSTPPESAAATPPQAVASRSAQVEATPTAPPDARRQTTTENPVSSPLAHASGASPLHGMQGRRPTMRVAPVNTHTTEPGSASRGPASHSWAVQLGVYSDHASAERRSERALASIPASLADVRVAMGPSTDGQGVLAQLIAPSERDAREACSVLQRSHLPCIVIPPGRTLFVATQ